MIRIVFEADTLDEALKMIADFQGKASFPSYETARDKTLREWAAEFRANLHGLNLPVGLHNALARAAWIVDKERIWEPETEDWIVVPLARPQLAEPMSFYRRDKSGPIPFEEWVQANVDQDPWMVRGLKLTNQIGSRRIEQIREACIIWAAQNVST